MFQSSGGSQERRRSKSKEDFVFYLLVSKRYQNFYLHMLAKFCGSVYPGKKLLDLFFWSVGFFFAGWSIYVYPGRTKPRGLGEPASPYTKISGLVARKSFNLIFVRRVLRIAPPPFHHPTEKDLLFTFWFGRFNLCIPLSVHLWLSFPPGGRCVTVHSC